MLLKATKLALDLQRNPLAVVLAESLVGYAGLCFQPRDLHADGKRRRDKRILGTIEPTLDRQHAALRLPERVAAWSRRAGVDEARVVVRDQQRRWASCDDRGTIRFNWRIVQAPMRLVDYVVVHELVHLRHKDHSKAFWALLGWVMPDYERRREELRRNGPRLGW